MVSKELLKIKHEMRAYTVPEKLIKKALARSKNPTIYGLLKDWERADDMRRLNIQEDLATILRDL